MGKKIFTLKTNPKKNLMKKSTEQSFYQSLLQLNIKVEATKDPLDGHPLPQLKYPTILQLILIKRKANCKITWIQLIKVG